MSAPAAALSPTLSESTAEQPNLKVPSGGNISAASSEIAEKQRMESSADPGSVVNTSSTNNNSSRSNQNSKQKADDVYNSDLMDRLAYS
jgi:hypothetical protein